MGAETLYNTAGRELIVEAARFMGHQFPERLGDKELIGVCSILGDMYDHPRTGMYKRIRPWQDETVIELRQNKGLMTNAFGITRWFFGSPDDHVTQRALSSQYGQSGTSGNINRALNSIFYRGVDDGRTCMFVLQVHDSLKFLVHKSVLHEKVRAIKEIMEEPVTINGRTFVVPTEITVGLTDGKRMLDYRPNITYADLIKHEAKEYSEKFDYQKWIVSLETTQFSIEDLGLDAEELEPVETDQEEASESGVLEAAQ